MSACKCGKEAVTEYKDSPVCGGCWQRESFKDDHVIADRETPWGDYSEFTGKLDA